MKLHRIKTLTSCGALAIGLAACGGGEARVIPLFVFGFSGTTTGNVQVGVFFDPDNPSTASGSFNFVNLNIDGNITQYNGSWSNCSFTLSLPQGQTAQAPAAASYTGRFQGMETIVLSPASGAGLPTFTLQRQGTSTRSFAC
jgi:hypothetical protein